MLASGAAIAKVSGRAVRKYARRYPVGMDTVTKRYCDGVDHKLCKQLRICITHDDVLTGLTSNTVNDGEAAISASFTRLCEQLPVIWHAHFVHTADLGSNSDFPLLTELISPDGTNDLRYENCNRFCLKR